MTLILLALLLQIPQCPEGECEWKLVPDTAGRPVLVDVDGVRIAYPVVVPPDTGGNFEERCTAPGVVFCDSLDDAGAWWVDEGGTRHVFTNPDGSIGIPIEGWGRRSRGVVNNCLKDDIESGISEADSRFTLPAIDHSMAASGNGSLHFTLPARSGNGCSGNFETNFSPNLSRTFGPGTEDERVVLHYQYRIRYNCDFIYLDCDPDSPTYKTERRHYRRMNNRRGGYAFTKKSILHSSDWIENAGTDNERWVSSNSCDAFQIVVNQGWEGTLGSFHACGWYAGFNERAPDVRGSNNWHFHNGFKHGGTARHDYRLPDGTRRGIGNVHPDAWQFDSDQWITIQQRVEIGPYQQAQTGERLSHITTWAAYEGEPQQIIFTGPFDFRGEDGHAFGKMWFGMFSTDKDPTEEHPAAHAWYDEFIVSTEFIGDPQ